MTESEAFEHWIDTFDGELVVTNRLIWAAAWKAATKAEREACAALLDGTDLSSAPDEMKGWLANMLLAYANAMRARSNK